MNSAGGLSLIRKSPPSDMISCLFRRTVAMKDTIAFLTDHISHRQDTALAGTQVNVLGGLISISSGVMLIIVTCEVRRILYSVYALRKGA